MSPEKNQWVLSQVFSSPYTYFGSKVYVGGKGIENYGGKEADFIFKNSLDNIALIEIKTPCTKLVIDQKYRTNVFALSKELTGGINQILAYKQTLYNQYYSINTQSKKKFNAINIDCILIIGNTNELLDENKKECIENFRNELRSVRIVTFDEILKKIEIMLGLLKQEQTQEDVINNPN